MPNKTYLTFPLCYLDSFSFHANIVCTTYTYTPGSLLLYVTLYIVSIWTTEGGRERAASNSSTKSDDATDAYVRRPLVFFDPADRRTTD